MSRGRVRRAAGSPVVATAAALVLLQAAVLALSLGCDAAAVTADAEPDYREALSKSLLYFEAQRSGRLPYNQRVRWRGHSGITDGLQQGVDLVGGYYDAGDHVKFGLPMAFTVTMLSWGAIEFGDEIAAAGEWHHTLEAIKWGTDYFIKAHTEPFVYWAEVGDGDTDHYCWQRPEDMTTSRKAYRVDKDNPGSDLVAETAAALAAASIVFRASNPHYSHILLHHAQQLFEFGDRYRGNYDMSITEVRGFYASVSGYRDELLWAAFWLHRATGKEEFLRYAVDKADCFGGVGWAMTEFSWDVKYAGLQVLASKLLLDGDPLGKQDRLVLEQYRAKAEHYLCACLRLNNGSNVDRSPGGMLYVRQWNNLQYASSAAFLLTVYSRYLAGAGARLRCPDAPAVPPSELLALARSQAEYILGRNPLRLSYMVGYGPRFPAHVHHRAASIVSHKANNRFIGCMQGFDNWYTHKRPNPNVLTGAIVGGPNCRDEFRDDRTNYVQTEACTYNTAPMVAVFARLHNLSTAAAEEGCRPGAALGLSAKCR
ncbi:endoglucanase 22-like [Triticum dicoccoides]|uniref:Endoglucanase n=1 Tax=Triticum aestivum TaxID=4565 RepID=A0A3B6LLZ0_WHEAT|nr:endoglucanase 22-like [Triticum dicoccoides]XP_044388707.1 endoglucanase 22-like [Triticum aestivum]